LSGLYKRTVLPYPCKRWLVEVAASGVGPKL
jgi:hypothetical protein